MKTASIRINPAEMKTASIKDISLTELIANETLASLPFPEGEAK
jgi:hypothetical protein